MIDSHCHLDSIRFDVDRIDLLARAEAAGVSDLIVPGVTPDTWEALVDLKSSAPRIHVALGVHPQALAEMKPSADDAAMIHLERLLQRGVALAVGECGLDGPTLPLAPIDRQLSILKKHWDLSVHYQLPIIVHCFRTHPQFQAFLKSATTRPPAIVLHSYSGSAELVPFYTSHGCYFSFAGPITYPGARRPVEALRAVPLDRLLIETDAPAQSPHPFRGQRNEPSHLGLVAQAVARERTIPVDTVVDLTSANAKAVFWPHS